MITIELPMPYYKTNSKALMSMNVYRNAHFAILSKFKASYGDLCRESMAKLDERQLELLMVTYELHTKPTKAGKPKIVDMMNVLSMVDKTFMDILVVDKWIIDDSIEHINYVRFKADAFSERDYISVILEEKQ